MAFILTVDLGTSGPKVSLFDERARLLGSCFEEVPLLLFEGGGAEQRPSDWLNGIRAAYRRLIAETKVNPKKITAINCTAQWSGTVAVDAQGLPLMNALIWMDSRGAPYALKVMDGLIKAEGYGVLKLLKWLRLTGGAPGKLGKDPIAHILYLKHRFPEIYSKTFKFLEPKDYLNLFFTGIFASSFDAITLHWVTDNRKINQITYHSDLLKMTGLDRNQLPDLVPTNSILGKVSKTIAQEFGLSEDVVVVSGAGDIHTAAVGSGAVKDFEGHLYVGTSSWIVCHVPFKKVDVLHNMATLPSAIPGRYMIANEQQTSGACLNYLKQNLFFPKDEIDSRAAPSDFYRNADALVEKVAPGSEGLHFLPWMYGERSPMDDAYTRGGFLNMSLHHTRGHLLRAVYEGVAFNSKWLLHYVEKMIGRRFEGLNFIGGGAKSAVWSQIFADICDRPIHAMKDPITCNSRGTAILALMALGELKLEEVGQTVEIEKTFLPNPENRSLYEQRFKRYLEMYQSNKSMYAKLNAGAKA